MDANGHADFTRAGGSATPASRRPLAFLGTLRQAEQLSVPSMCSREKPTATEDRIVRTDNGTWAITPGEAIGR